MARWGGRAGTKRTLRLPEATRQNLPERRGLEAWEERSREKGPEDEETVPPGKGTKTSV